MTNVLFQIAPVSELMALVNRYSLLPKLTACALSIKLGLAPGKGETKTVILSIPLHPLDVVDWTMYRVVKLG